MHQGVTQDTCYRTAGSGTIEHHLLGSSRSHDLPGSMVPEFYETYLQSGNPGPLVPIVQHNLEDVTSLAKLLFHFLEGPA